MRHSCFIPAACRQLIPGWLQNITFDDGGGDGEDLILLEPSFLQPTLVDLITEGMRRVLPHGEYLVE